MYATPLGLKPQGFISRFEIGLVLRMHIKVRGTLVPGTLQVRFLNQSSSSANKRFFANVAALDSLRALAMICANS